jgi:hypothetical protein
MKQKGPKMKNSDINGNQYNIIPVRVISENNNIVSLYLEKINPNDSFKTDFVVMTNREIRGYRYNPINILKIINKNKSGYK